MNLQADSRHIPLDDKSVNCIITSPPYWSLRKYDIPDLIWDGDEGCEHEWIKHFDPPRGGKCHPDRPSIVGANRHMSETDLRGVGIKSDFCLKCSAWRGQLGLEPTIDLYLKHLLSIFDECKRVLRDDGTLWVNLGDSYSMTSVRGGDKPFGNGVGANKHYAKGSIPFKRAKQTVPSKSLCLIPERFAIEMVNRGWILRNKIIWHKPNCMPSSAKDRFTVDFEPVFFFVKSKKYWFEQQYDEYSESYLTDSRHGSKELSHVPQKDYSGQGKIVQTPTQLHDNMFTKSMGQGRNRRCVWTIPTQPYPESHFATFPEALVEPMIRAGCPQFVCKKCGKAREKILDRSEKVNAQWGERKSNPQAFRDKREMPQKVIKSVNIKEIGLTDCGCNAGFEPGVVLDPFCGSGTVLRVAESLNRKAIGIDLGYQELQNGRISNNQKVLFA